ncbi:MAG: OmpA family protein [Haliscomenobacter sp.]|nr:OmpA family protein [Haliscomenobacter sp.]
MSTTTRIILLLLGWLVYTLLLMQFCSRDICKTCGISIAGEEAGLVTDTSQGEPVNAFPLSFRWSNAEPFQGPGFDSLLASIKAGTAADNKLEITGLYFEEESAPADVETMGLARAAKIRDKFFSDIPPDRISLRSRLKDETAGVRENYFEAALFNWIAIEKKVAETVEELDDRIIIRFPFNSTEKDYDPEVDAYLAKLAKRVNQTEELVKLTGHTDNVGDDAANLSFGDKRAQQIKQILVRSGVKASLITTESKGESQPVASNATEEGRHDNRRVEVRLIKKQ